MKKPGEAREGTQSPRGRRSRPAIKTSHEKVLHEKVFETARAKPAKQGKAARGGAPPRAAAKVKPLTSEDRDPSPQWSVASDVARERATAIAVAALDKKAVGLEILDVAGKVDYADFLVIMTGRSDRHAQALAQGIEEALKVKGVRPMAVEGLPHGSWVLMDFGDVVVHVFLDETRQLYDLEGLWLDARRMAVPSPVE